MLSEEDAGLIEDLKKWLERAQLNLTKVDKFVNSTQDRMDRVMATAGLLATIQQEAGVLFKWLHYPVSVTTLSSEDTRQVMNMVKEALTLLIKARMLIAKSAIENLPKENSPGAEAYMSLLAEPILTRLGEWPPQSGQ